MNSWIKYFQLFLVINFILAIECNAYKFKIQFEDCGECTRLLNNDRFGVFKLCVNFFRFSLSTGGPLNFKLCCNPMHFD